MTWKKLFASGLFISAFGCVSLSSAATVYISTTGSDSNVCSTGSRCLTLNKLKSVSTCGDTWIVGDGTYTQTGNIWNPTNIPSCSSWGSSITIRAENRFQAVFATNTANAMLALGGSGDSTNTTYYLYVDGVVFDYNSTKSVQGNHVKMNHVWFIGGPTSGNSSNLGIGNNNFGASTYGATDVTIANFLILGRKVADGGSARYGGLAFNGNGIIFRHGYIHMNNGYTCGACGNPSANINFYNTQNTYGLNVFAFDDQEDPPDFYQGGLYATSNNGTGAVGALNQSGYYGSASINNADYASRMDGNQSVSSFTYLNDVGVDNKQGGITMGSGVTTHAVRLANITLINSSITAVADGIAQFDSGGTKSLINLIISSFPAGKDFNGVSGATFYDSYNNSTITNGTGKISVDPLLNGASTWLKIEAGSFLKSTGSASGQMGAQIDFQIGADTAAWGDTGWDQPTSIALFPNPDDAAIKAMMCRTYSTGVCSSTYSALTISQYLQARGAFSNITASTPAAPTSISTTAVNMTSINYSYVASTDTDTTGYKVDLSTDNFSTFSAGYNNTDLGNVTSSIFTGLTASTTYSFRLRAYNSTNTGANSLTQTGTTSAPVVAPSRSITVGPSVTFGASVTLK